MTASEHYESTLEGEIGVARIYGNDKKVFELTQELQKLKMLAKSKHWPRLNYKKVFENGVVVTQSWDV